MQSEDRDILRRLAEDVAAIAAMPKQADNRALWRAVNDLEPGRPPVLIYQIPWVELEQSDEELRLSCVDPEARTLEQAFRRSLYQWRCFPGNMVVDGVVDCPMVIHDSGYGICQEGEVQAAPGGTVNTQHFTPQIRCEADVQKIRMPHVHVDHEATAIKKAQLEEVFEGILPVRVRGVRGVWFAPWDFLIRYYGVEESLADMALCPDLVHAAMDRMVAALMHRLDQYEAQGALEANAGNERTGSGGLAYSSELPAVDDVQTPVAPAQQWGCAAAQIFSAVSPAMHEEFALRYELRWLERFGLNYYGCCEPLDRKLEILEAVPNLRKVSMSPWADLNRAVAQGAGQRYVLSIKPSPAFLAERTWEPARAEADFRKLIEQTRGCAVEIALKDISTVLGEPRRLVEWHEMAQRCLDKRCC